MNKRSCKLILLSLLLVVSIPALLYASNRPVVTMFPFNVQAEKSNETISQAIVSLLKRELEKYGVKVVLDQTVIDPSVLKSWGYEQFRKKAVAQGADWSITGNIFILGQQVSIDVAMWNTYQKNLPITFSSYSEFLGGLTASVDNINESIIAQLFEKRIISLIKVEGNKRVEADAILRVIASKEGDIASQGKLSSDLKKIYAMGYFDDVIVKQQAVNQGGLEITFHVEEKPSVRRVEFKDNVVYSEKELFDIIETSTGSILNIYKLHSDVDKLKRLYEDKNYHNCKIEYKITNLLNNQADIQFIIDQGDKVRIHSISFEGNKHFTKKNLLGQMKTSEKGFWSFITSSGELDESQLDNDVLLLESFYQNNGFINIKISDPDIQFDEKGIAISFKIDEGDQFKVGRIDLQGDFIIDKKKLLKAIQIESGQFYSRESVRKEMINLTDLYSNMGYANAEVIPMLEKSDDDKKSVNIVFNITKGELIHFNRIVITGNTKTRDKVIRREMAVDEQGVFSKAAIQRSYRNLVIKDYFESIELIPMESDYPNSRDFEVKVKEKATGSVSFGGGFSSEEGGFGQVAVTDSNLFGKGQKGKLMSRFSNETILYMIGFTEPWLFDRPIMGGIDIYKLEKEFDYYDKDSYGLTLSNGFRNLLDYTVIGFEYHIEDFEIRDVNSSKTNVRETECLSSSITPYIHYDSRNHPFLPTRGFVNKFSVKYSGEAMGGDIDYIKYRGEIGGWIPAFWKFVLSLHVEAGYLDDRTDSSIIDIDWERFYLGGINSIRGFESGDINGMRDGDTIERGGEKYFLFNTELIFPIKESIGLAGVIFYDQGDVYRISEDVDFLDQYSSVGLELRWHSPMGPLRIAYGIVANGKGLFDNGAGRFDFSVGAFF